MTHRSQAVPWRGAVLRPVALAILQLAATAAHATCDDRPFDGERREVVGERLWINGLSTSIVELPGLAANPARSRFAEYWRKEHQETRSQVANDVEVVSTYRDGCLYALQIPLGSARGMPPRFAVTDLREARPSLPRSFEWPPAAEAELLTDTVSADGGRLSRLLSYRSDTSAVLASNQTLLRLVHGDWKPTGLTQLNGRDYTFSAHKGAAAVDVTVTRNGSGSVTTLNFSESGN